VGPRSPLACIADRTVTDEERDRAKLEAATEAVRMVLGHMDEPIRSQMLEAEDNLIAQVLAYDETMTKAADEAFDAMGIAPQTKGAGDN
jgi:hypothetical protein